MATLDREAEWLEADGLGGFAMGTVGLCRRRRYHALLCAATKPPAGRSVLVAGQDAIVQSGGAEHALSAQCYHGDAISPRGDQSIVSFAAEPWPTWEFALPDGARVRHELFVPRGAAAVVQQWTLVQPAKHGGPVLLDVRPFLAGRDYHALRREHDGPAPVETRASDGATDGPADGAAWAFGRGLPPVVARSNGDYRSASFWYRGFHYGEERARGYDAVEDLFAPGVFTFDLTRGSAWLLFAAGTLPAAWNGTAAAVTTTFAAVRARELARRSALPSPLHRAAEAYVVDRGAGSSLIAGYPWFADWGRDTFVALRGIALATSRHVARDVLCEWAQHLDAGMLPNRFPDRQGEIEYHTVDAALWFVVAAHEHLTSGSVERADRDLLTQAILSIVHRYALGTRHGIAMDPDGLLRCGVPDLQLTWMDAIVAGRVVTPRVGKPVEVQALWGSALQIAASIDPTWQQAAADCRTAFAARFWNERQQCLFDVVDADHVAGRDDDSLRPNQILAVGGLPYPLLTGSRARAVVDAVQRELLTPLGLRSLLRGVADYQGRYEGTPEQRDAAYHNGTVWPWLLGPFVEAWVSVHGGTDAVRLAARQQFLPPLHRHLQTAGLGHLSEIADAEAPHTPRGCPFQAWSLGELLRLELQVLRTGARRPATPPADAAPRRRALPAATTNEPKTRTRP